MAKHSNEAETRRRLTRAKARKILEDGAIRGRPLTSKQRGLFGAIASGRAAKVSRHA